MKKALLALVLFLVMLPCAARAQGGIVYEYELVSQSEGLFSYGQVLPLGYDNHYESGKYFSADRSQMYIIQFLGGHTGSALCGTVTCYFAGFHFERVSLPEPEPGGMFGWTDAPLIKEYDGNITATSIWSGRWLAASVTNGVMESPFREILIFVMVALVGTRAFRIIKRYLAPETLRGEGTEGEQDTEFNGEPSIGGKHASGNITPGDGRE